CPQRGVRPRQGPTLVDETPRCNRVFPCCPPVSWWDSSMVDSNNPTPGNPERTNPVQKLQFEFVAYRGVPPNASVCHRRCCTSATARVAQSPASDVPQTQARG